MKKILLILALVVSYCSGYAQETIEIDKKIELAKSKLKKDNNLEYNKSQVLAILDSLKIDIKNQDSIYRAEIDSLYQTNKKISNEVNIYKLLFLDSSDIFHQDNSFFVNLWEEKNIYPAYMQNKISLIMDIREIERKISEVEDIINKYEKDYHDHKNKDELIREKIKDNIETIKTLTKPILSNKKYLLTEKQFEYLKPNLTSRYNNFGKYLKES